MQRRESSLQRSSAIQPPSEVLAPNFKLSTSPVRTASHPHWTLFKLTLTLAVYTLNDNMRIKNIPHAGCGATRRLRSPVDAFGRQRRLQSRKTTTQGLRSTDTRLLLQQHNDVVPINFKALGKPSFRTNRKPEHFVTGTDDGPASASTAEKSLFRNDFVDTAG